MVTDIISGLTSVFQPLALVYLFAGVIIGLILGILPGLSGLTGFALLFPLVYGWDPVLALTFLLGMYAPAYTGGALTAILLNIPGTSANAATMMDGFPLTKQGKSGRALGAAFAAAPLGGIFGALVLALIIPVIRPIIMLFGSAESLILILIGLSFISILGTGSPIKGVIAGLLGLMMSFVGYQGVSAVARYSFGSDYLYDGIRLVPLALGLFALPEAFNMITTGKSISRAENAPATWSDLFQGIKDVFRHWTLVIRGSIIGTIVGIIPGIGGDVAVWIAYGHAKQTSKHPESFGHGNIEGVIAPESASHAKEGGCLIPTVAFGIPGSAAMAVLLGAFLVLGLQPGPAFVKEHLDLVFNMVATLVVANILGSVILMLSSRHMSKIAFVRGHILGPIILVFIALGAYAVAGNMLDVVSAFILGALGYAMTRLGYSKPALFLGYVLGALAETYFHISLAAYGWLFLTRPMVLVFIAIAVFTFLYQFGKIPFLKRLGKT